MIEKQSKLKGRRPSPKLWAMTRRFTEDQWRELKGLSQVYGKNSMQFKLVELLRSMPAYDPDLEKAEFAHCNLGSMRSTVKYWLIRSARRLGFYASDLENYCLDIDVVLEWQDWEEALFLIGEAKSLAIAQEEFKWLGTLLQQEKAALRGELAGEERTKALQQIDEAIIANSKLLLLQAEIDAETTRYIEHAKYHFRETAEVDTTLPKQYFQSAFHQTNMTGWPLSFQFEKLRIEELCHFFLGEFSRSIAVVEQRLRLLDRNVALRTRLAGEHSNALFRVATYYMEMGDWDKVTFYTSTFRSLKPFEVENRNNYLRRFLFVLYRTGFVLENLELIAEATVIWENHQEYLKSLPRDNIGVIIMLLACSGHLAAGNVVKARQSFAYVHESFETIPNKAFQGLFRIFHLMILLEDRDAIGLESYGTNYRRYIRKSYPEGSPSRSLLILLAKPTNLDGEVNFKKMLVTFKAVLIKSKETQSTELWSFLFPLISWADRLLLPK